MNTELTLFESLLIAHVVGDYFLQPIKMAIQKGEKGVKGFLICLIHCLVYAFPFLFICTDPDFSVWIILTHFLIDRYSIGNCILSIIDGRSFEWYMNERFGNERIANLHAGFTAVVYVIVDNFIHLMSMYLFLRFLM